MTRCSQQQRGVEQAELAESVQEARDLRCGSPTPARTTPRRPAPSTRSRWIGAGWPDYPWLFATDGEYTAFAAVAAGQFERDRGPPARAPRRQRGRQRRQRQGGPRGHVRRSGLLRRQRRRGQHRRDREVPERRRAGLALDRATTSSATRCTASRCSNMRYVFRELDTDGDGWPEGLGNVERPGMGEEKLDNTVYTIRGLRDLADLAQSKGDDATRSWATAKADDLREAVRHRRGGSAGGTSQYADSLDDPGNAQGLPAALDRRDARRGRAASGPGGRRVRWPPTTTPTHWCRSARSPATPETYGMFHTGTGATSDAAGNPGPTCDAPRRRTTADREVFTLNTSIMAVAEAALGRMGADQLRHYTTATRPCSSTRRCGRSRVPCPRSRRRRTSAPTSTSGSPSGPA